VDGLLEVELCPSFSFEHRFMTERSPCEVVSFFGFRFSWVFSRPFGNRTFFYPVEFLLDCKGSFGRYHHYVLFAVVPLNSIFGVLCEGKHVSIHLSCTAGFDEGGVVGECTR